MPKTDTISDVLKCDASYVPEVVSGTVVAVAQGRAGKMTTPPFKDYSVQRITIGDREGNKIDVHVWDRDELDQSIVGQTLHIMSGVGTKGQRIGLKLEDRAYTGNDGNQYSDRRIKLYPTGQLSIGTYGFDRQGNPTVGRSPGSGAPPVRQNAPQQAGARQPTRMQQGQQTPRSASPGSKADASGGFDDVRKRAAKLAVMMELSWLGAMAVSNVVGKRGGYAMGDAALQSVASSIFIALDRAGMSAFCPTKFPDDGGPVALPAQEPMANADADPTVDGADPHDDVPPVDDSDNIPF